MKTPKVLFVLKERKIYNSYSSSFIHSGLYNSATFVSNMLRQNGIESNLVNVIDNNGIDREIHKFKPTHVIIEALWVVPSKFEVLHKKYPHITWIIRVHSEIPFIAGEGIAMEWLYDYMRDADAYNIVVAPNSEKMLHDIRSIGIKNTEYLPNYYPLEQIQTQPEPIFKNHIDIGCFGAIRPMKNQLIHAIAAIQFGDDLGIPVHFHINASRVEKGESALRNIREVFANNPQHTLVEHEWYSHHELIHLIRRMDLGLQVSFNETYNIVAADFAANGIPIVGSAEIKWMSWVYQALPTCSRSIKNRLKIAYFGDIISLQKLNKWNLVDDSEIAKLTWLAYFR
jgi:hypothetical protein